MTLPEVQDVCSETSHGACSLGLECRSAGKNVREGVRPDADYCPCGEGEVVHERRKEAAIGNRVQINEIVGDAVPAANHQSSRRAGVQAKPKRGPGL